MRERERVCVRVRVRVRVRLCAVLASCVHVCALVRDGVLRAHLSSDFSMRASRRERRRSSILASTCGDRPKARNDVAG
eukprot:6193115-Pleurochrysis_carterae.AAC.5